jgi:hypothetical protein
MMFAIDRLLCTFPLSLELDVEVLLSQLLLRRLLHRDLPAPLSLRRYQHLLHPSSAAATTTAIRHPQLMQPRPMALPPLRLPNRQIRMHARRPPPIELRDFG